MPEKRVLVVEDDRIIANLIGLMLTRKGHVVVDSVITGEEAIARALYNAPDLVLMDIHLKGTIDGIYAARQIYSAFNIPVIFLTAVTDDDIVERAKKAEPFGFIAKPFTERNLIPEVEVALHKHESLKGVLKASENRVEEIRESPDAVILADNDGRIYLLNPEAEAILEIGTKEAVNRPLREVFPVVGDVPGQPSPGKAGGEPVKERAPSQMDNVILMSRSGVRRFISVKVRPLKDQKNQHAGVVVIIHDKAKDSAERDREKK
jgi:PAS domain S-box-containing protein